MAKIHFIADLWFTQGLHIRFLFIVNLLQNAFLEKLFSTNIFFTKKLSFTKKKTYFYKRTNIFQETPEPGAIYWCFLASFARD